MNGQLVRIQRMIRGMTTINSSNIADGLNDLVFNAEPIPLGVRQAIIVSAKRAVSQLTSPLQARGSMRDVSGEIYVGGRNVIQSAGYHLVAINAMTGVVDRTDRFDTCKPNDLGGSRNSCRALPSGGSSRGRGS
jgi:hypothetical protein